MDKGAFIRGGYAVEPGDGGSFVVRQGFGEPGRLYGGIRGFTNYRDLLTWLDGEHRAAADAHPELPPTDVTKGR